MAVKELKSFICKFNQLWHSGMSAHLDMDTHAGEAWVGLRVRLGHAPVPIHHSNLQRTRDSPSRGRRRERRAAQRNQAHVGQTDADAEEAAAESVDVEIIEENIAEEAIEGVVAEKVMHRDDNKEISEVVEEATITDSNDEVAVEADPKTVEEQVELASNSTAGVETRNKKLESVYAVAHFENLPNGTLTADDLTSLEKFIFSEKHLEDNIAKYEFKVLSNFEVTLLFQVKTDRLWENSRQYLWKHLGGTNYWDRQNGTRIWVKKIHVK